VADYDMVEEVNIKEFTGLHDLARHQDILFMNVTHSTKRFSWRELSHIVI
jgi:hypothetical protein